MEFWFTSEGSIDLEKLPDDVGVLYHLFPHAGIAFVSFLISPVPKPIFVTGPREQLRFLYPFLEKLANLRFNQRVAVVRGHWSNLVWANKQRRVLKICYNFAPKDNIYSVSEQLWMDLGEFCGLKLLRRAKSAEVYLSPCQKLEYLEVRQRDKRIKRPYWIRGKIEFPGIGAIENEFKPKRPREFIDPYDTSFEVEFEPQITVGKYGWQ